MSKPYTNGYNGYSLETLRAETIVDMVRNQEVPEETVYAFVWRHKGRYPEVDKAWAEIKRLKKELRKEAELYWRKRFFYNYKG